MSRISSTGITTSAGLVSGIPIEDTVNQLIQISAAPRDRLADRTDAVRAERAAVDQLAALVLSLQSSTSRFSSSQTFTGRSAATSSDTVSVSVDSGNPPAVGSYQFTPLRTASAHQFASTSIEDPATALTGTLRIGFGGSVNQGLDLRQLNGGAGVPAGEIKITDKAGDSAIIDLRAAQTIDEVLTAINASTDIDVTASVDGDRFVITDNTGDSGTLRVRDVGTAETASALGLDGLTASGASTQLLGADVYSLSTETKLADLNDGIGVGTGSDVDGINDLDFRLRDGTSAFGVDLVGAETLGDVIDAINNAEGNEGRLTAALRSDGRGIEVTDNTESPTDNLIVTSDFGVAESLGLDTGESGVTESTASGRIASGLKDSLVRTLNGGQGIELGLIDVADRSTDTLTAIDLSGAETLGEIVELINASGVQIEARINDAGTGIVVSDTSGGSGTLRISDTGDTGTATNLGIAVDAEVSSVSSGPLGRQSISVATRLEDLNGGRGVELGDFRITNSLSQVGAVDLNSIGNEAETVGDVIKAINALSIGVTAGINATGDGIELTDFAEGEGTLTVTQVGNATTAADLNLLGAATGTNADGQQVIDGSLSYEINLDDLSESSQGIALSSLNGGSGVDLGVIRITSSLGVEAEVNLGEPGNEAFTIGDVVDRINATTQAGVSAAINSAGTGIVLTDTAGGDLAFKVEDVGSGTAALDLGIAGESDLPNGIDPVEIDSGFLFTTVDAEDSPLDALVERINALEAGFSASVLEDATGQRLVVTADNAGAARQLVLDSSGTGLTFSETSQGRDAVGLLGPSGAGGVVVRSEDNTFDSVIDGLDLTINQANGESVVIDVATDNSAVLDTAQGFVDAYNSLRITLDDFTSFDAETLTTGILFGRNEVIRVESDLSRIFSGRLIFGVEYGSLESVGIGFTTDGQLELDRTALSNALADDPVGVEELFSKESDGLADRLTTAVDQLARDADSLLASRSDQLERTVESNEERIETLTESLERERERLLLEFIRLEETIALLQSNTTAIDSIQPISFASLNSNSN